MAGVAKPDMQTTGKSGQLSARTCTMSKPSMPGMMRSVRTRSMAAGSC
jgi:hypothetical protein